MKKPTKDKKKKPRRKAVYDAEGNEIPADPAEDDEYKIKIVYHPSLDECKSFIRERLETVVEKNNLMQTLENELMPFLNLQS